jgi:hypothetical protein
MKIRKLAALIVAASLAIATGVSAQGASSKTQLHDTMRRLWVDHVTWTRFFIVGAAGGLPDTKLTTDRLLRNQDDMGAAIAAYYGSDAGHKLTALLKTHISTAGEVVMATKAGDQVKLADAKRRWYANADDIAAFLAALNPKHWPLATMQSSMKAHLDRTADEATHRIQGNFAADIADFDQIVPHILMLADLMSDGIAAQFPQKFATNER